MVYCVEDLQVIPDDPTQAVKLPKAKETDGFYTWEEEDIERFERTHPVGTRARLAFALALYTLQRRNDLVRLGPQHIRSGAFQVKQKNTGRVLSIPVHPELKRVLDATPKEHLTFITTRRGKPFTKESYGAFFAEVCKP